MISKAKVDFKVDGSFQSFFVQAPSFPPRNGFRHANFQKVSLLNPLLSPAGMAVDTAPVEGVHPIPGRL